MVCTCVKNAIGIAYFLIRDAPLQKERLRKEEEDNEEENFLRNINKQSENKIID